MQLTEEEREILNGRDGEVMARVMETVVRFGDVFGARNLVKVTHPEAHLVTSFGIGLLKPLFSTMDKLIEAGIRVPGGFTVDPRPLDYDNVKCSFLEKLVFNKILYSKQEMYESQMDKVGLRNRNGFSCACYLDEVGNIPEKGDVLSWAESSAVVYANSVLGARCNRNSGMIELFGAILGKVPNFGLVTDEGRKATWKVILKTTKRPEAQILGSAIGMKVMEDVPYVIGLDKYLGCELTSEAKSYLKDFGAATASNGAVGLYHIANLTPEAKELGESLLVENAREYVIDDAELERVYRSYPNMWRNPEAKADKVFIGCPHLSFEQLGKWTEDIDEALKKSGKDKVQTEVIMTSAPDVVARFKTTPDYDRLMKMGVHLTSICPLMYTNNPLTKKKAIATNSNKLRTYSRARYYKDADILKIISGEVR